MRLDSVCLHHGPVSALSDVSCTLPAKGIVVLFGPNGAGKSSFIDVIAGAVAPTTGAVVDDRGRRVSRRSLIERSARLFQRNVVPSVSAASLLAFASQHRRASDLLKRPQEVDLPFDAAALLRDCNVNGSLERSLTHLSGGQQRICLLVAALLRPSPVLLLDEPFAGIAAPATERLLEILPQEAMRRLVVVVDHESDRLFGSADRLLGLRAGELLLDTTPEATDAQSIARVYGE